MPGQFFFSSLTRISPLPDESLSLEVLPKEDWETGDYIVCEVDRRPTGHNRVELTSGRHAELAKGDQVVGAIGVRRATVEGTGTWRAVGEDGRMHMLTSGGLMGKLTSKPPFGPSYLSIAYRGHVMMDGKRATMRRFVPVPVDIPFQIPTVLVTGSSMSAGKTAVAKAIIRRLKRMNCRVLGAKITGAGRYRDIIGMHDAGADWIYDFVDAGMPSTVFPTDEYRSHLHDLLAMMADKKADVAVVEIGSSPLEPYNGEAAIDAISHAVRCTALAATDPYALLGTMNAFGQTPDFACGPAVNTDAGKELARALCDVRVLNAIDPAEQEDLDQLLRETLEL